MTRENSPRKPSVEGHCDHHCGGTATERDGNVLRCACGSLLARYVDGGLELKCRRCKRTVIVPANAKPEEASTA
jgi:phage FluMu protein Com